MCYSKPLFEYTYKLLSNLHVDIHISSQFDRFIDFVDHFVHCVRFELFINFSTKLCQMTCLFNYHISIRCTNRAHSYFIFAALECVFVCNHMFSLIEHQCTEHRQLQLEINIARVKKKTVFFLIAIDLKCAIHMANKLIVNKVLLLLYRFSHIVL